MKKNGNIHIGTSGWHYRHWRGLFYPRGLPPKKWLEFYRDHFQTVEINNSFYHLPEIETMENWKETVPPGFVFAIKAGRYITHMKKLKEPEDALFKFFGRAEKLGDRLGPILFQLPPRWRCNPGRLEAFLELLPQNHRYVFEFRDPSWFDSRIYRLLSRSGATFCIYQLAGRLSPRRVTADFVYVRLHGPGAAYRGSYSARDLSGWAGAFSTWSRMGKEVYCYFDNDYKGYAPQNALQLKEMLKKD